MCTFGNEEGLPSGQTSAYVGDEIAWQGLGKGHGDVAKMKALPLTGATELPKPQIWKPDPKDVEVGGMTNPSANEPLVDATSLANGKASNVGDIKGFEGNQPLISSQPLPSQTSSSGSATGSESYGYPGYVSRDASLTRGIPYGYEGGRAAPLPNVNTYNPGPNGGVTEVSPGQDIGGINALKNDAEGLWKQDIPGLALLDFRRKQKAQLYPGQNLVDKPYGHPGYEGYLHRLQRLPIDYVPGYIANPGDVSYGTVGEAEDTTPKPDVVWAKARWSALRGAVGLDKSVYPDAVGELSDEEVAARHPKDVAYKHRHEAP